MEWTAAVLPNVTAKIVALIKGKHRHPSIKVDNDKMGGDPAPLQVKELRVGLRAQWQTRYVAISGD